MGLNCSKRKDGTKVVEEEVEEEKVKEEKLMQCKLKELYKQLNIPRVAWMGERMELPIQEFYFKLKLTSSDQEIHHDEMFKEIKTKRILVEGLPGYGKTTLATKIAHDWAVNEEYTQRFHFVFLLSIRELREKSVIDAIIELIQNSGFDKPVEVKRKIEDEEDKSLLILDGLDEVSPNQREKILNILYRKEMKRMVVIVTCRSGEFSLKQDEDRALFSGLSIKTEFCDQQITILGIHNEDKVEFLTKFLHETKLVDKVIEYLKNVTETAQEFFDSPLMLILLADMVVRGKKIRPTTTRTNFYKDVVNFMIRRSQERKKVELSKSFNVFDEKNEENGSFKRKLHQFGYLCFQRVWDGNQLEFDEDELIESIHQLGLVNIRKRLSNISSTNYYQIYHRTILEFMAAYYIHQQFLNTNLVFPKLIQHKLFIDVHYYEKTSMVTPFLIGLMKENASHYFSMSCKYIGLFQRHQNAFGRIITECENLAQLESALIPHLPSKMKLQPTCSSHNYKRLVTLGVQSEQLSDIKIDFRDKIKLPTDIELPNIHLYWYDNPAIEELKQIKCQRFHWSTLYNEEKVNECFKILPQICAKVHIIEISNEAVIYFLKKKDKWPANMEITIRIDRDLVLTNSPVVKEVCNLLDKCQIHSLVLYVDDCPELITILSHCKNVKYLYFRCNTMFCIPMDTLLLENQWESVTLENVELTDPAVKDFYACKSVTLDGQTSKSSCAFISKISDISYLECNSDALFQLMTCSSWQGFQTITQLDLDLDLETDYDYRFWKCFNSFHNLKCVNIKVWCDLVNSIGKEILEKILLLPTLQIILSYQDSLIIFILIEDISEILKNVIVKRLNTLIIRTVMYTRDDVLKCIEILHYCSEKKMSLKNLTLQATTADESIFETDNASNVNIKYSVEDGWNTVLLSID